MQVAAQIQAELAACAADIYTNNNYNNYPQYFNNNNNPINSKGITIKYLIEFGQNSARDIGNLHVTLNNMAGNGVNPGNVAVQGTQQLEALLVHNLDHMIDEVRAALRERK